MQSIGILTIDCLEGWGCSSQEPRPWASWPSSNPGCDWRQVTHLALCEMRTVVAPVVRIK